MSEDVLLGPLRSLSPLTSSVAESTGSLKFKVIVPRLRSAMNDSRIGPVSSATYMLTIRKVMLDGFSSSERSVTAPSSNNRNVVSMDTANSVFSLMMSTSRWSSCTSRSSELSDKTSPPVTECRLRGTPREMLAEKNVNSSRLRELALTVSSKWRVRMPLSMSRSKASSLGLVVSRTYTSTCSGAVALIGTTGLPLMSDTDSAVITMFVLFSS